MIAKHLLQSSIPQPISLPEKHPVQHHSISISNRNATHEIPLKYPSIPFHVYDMYLLLILPTSIRPYLASKTLLHNASLHVKTYQHNLAKEANFHLRKLTLPKSPISIGKHILFSRATKFKPRLIPSPP